MEQDHPMQLQAPLTGTHFSSGYQLLFKEDSLMNVKIRQGNVRLVHLRLEGTKLEPCWHHFKRRMLYTRMWNQKSNKSECGH